MMNKNHCRFCMKLPLRYFLSFVLVLFSIEQASASTQTIFLWETPLVNKALINRALSNSTLLNTTVNINHEKISQSGAISQVINPRMNVYTPEHSNHVALLIISGGGYVREELAKEATPTSQYFQNQGFTVFELIYRLPNQDGHNHFAPFADGQRALRIIRSQANPLNYDADKIGVLGFSAGGHLAGILATQSNFKFYNPKDDLDKISTRPDFAVLLYPVINMQPPLNTTHAYKTLLGKNANSAEQAFFSVDLQVTSNTPATFLAHALDDPISSVENSKKMQHALEQNDVKNKLKIFKTGGHGWGLGKQNTPTTEWPTLLLDWLKSIKML